jgi:flagellar L-ring protein precursor FlgH
LILILSMVLLSVPVGASDRSRRSGLSPLSEYLKTYIGSDTVKPLAPGSLWSDNSPLADLSADNKAKHVDDVLTIRIAEQTLAESKADITSQRKFQTDSAITGLLGQIGTAGVNPLLAANSNTGLTGKGQASSQSQLRTSLAGRVVTVLPNGTMVIEAERRLRLNNETQTIVLRGMVRPADVLADNSVLSTSLANLEIELKGKGAVSDATRPPNRFTRAVLWLFGF